MRLLRRVVERVERLAQPLTDRANPILVKEVRQALRGRYFTVLFWLTLATATVIGAVLLVDESLRASVGSPSPNGGVDLFIAMYWCLSIAVHVFVPFAAFLSLGSEWDENTYDLLVISNLRPRHIVLGKLLSAGIQVGLYYCAFGPFLVFAFLLQGLDLVTAAWVMGMTLGTSLALCAVTLSLASISRLKVLRLFLMAMCSVGLGWAAIGFAVAADELVTRPSQVHAPDFLAAMLGVLSALVSITLLALAFATARLAHRDENRSSGLRVLTSGVLLVGLGWMAHVYSRVPEPWPLAFFSTVLFAVLLFSSIFLTSEEERLGRRVRLQVPRNRVLAVLATPFYPGGGRGMGYFLLHGSLIVAAAWGLAAWKPPSSSSPWMWIGTMWLVYGTVWLGLPTVAFARLSRHLPWRVLARFCVVLFALALLVVPVLVGFFLGDARLGNADHLGNPVWILDDVIEDGKDPRPHLAILAGIAGFVLLANAWRMGASVLEMARCSRERRDREAARASTPLAHPAPAGAPDPDAVPES